MEEILVTATVELKEIVGEEKLQATFSDDPAWLDKKYNLLKKYIFFGTGYDMYLDKTNKRIVVSQKHTRRFIRALRLLVDGVWEYKEYSVRADGTEKCDTRCRSARGDKCTCSCKEKYHKGGLAYTDGGGTYEFRVGSSTIIIVHGEQKAVATNYYPGLVTSEWRSMLDVPESVWETYEQIQERLKGTESSLSDFEDSDEGLPPEKDDSDLDYHVGGVENEW